MESKQPQRWLDFYERGWKVRGDLVKGELAKGATPFAALQKVFRFENLNDFGCRSDGSSEWIKKEYPAGSLTPVNTPWVRQGALFGKIITIPNYATPLQLVAEYLDENEFDVVLELGAGMGHNLIELLARGTSKKMEFIAGEYTKSGQEMAAALFASMPDVKSKVFFFDWKNPDFSSLNIEDKRVFLFSCHSCEQVTYLPSDLFDRLSRAGKYVRGFHFEPFGFQYGNPGEAETESSKIQREFFETNSWNQNFMDVFWKAKESRVINLTHLAKECFVPEDPCNATSFAAWDNQIDVEKTQH